MHMYVLTTTSCLLVLITPMRPSHNLPFSFSIITSVPYTHLSRSLSIYAFHIPSHSYLFHRAHRLSLAILVRFVSTNPRLLREALMVPLDVDDDDGGSVGLPNWSVPTTAVVSLVGVSSRWVSVIILLLWTWVDSSRTLIVIAIGTDHHCPWLGSRCVVSMVVERAMVIPSPLTFVWQSVPTGPSDVPFVFPFHRFHNATFHPRRDLRRQCILAVV